MQLSSIAFRSSKSGGSLSLSRLPFNGIRAGYFPLRAASAQAAAQPVKPPKPKPNKSATALKRSASASLPIRHNPTPTRGTIQPVTTFATAERYNFGALKRRLRDAVEFEEALWIPNWTNSGRSSEMWIFENGSIVSWGGDEAIAAKFLEEMRRDCPKAEVGRLDHIEWEELEFVTDPNEETRLQGDLLIIGKPPESSEVDTPQPLTEESLSPYLPVDTLAARYAFSQALARSTSLAGLESSLEDYLQSVAKLPISLSATGKPGLQRKDLIKKLGQLLRLRQSVNLTEESFGETPDFYWTEPALERCFDSVSKALEIRTRTKSVNDKITYAAEARFMTALIVSIRSDASSTQLQSTLRELLTESTTHRMELIIIALIAVEVILAFVRDGPELWEAAFGPPSSKEK